jgi:hypothetical protein
MNNADLPGAGYLPHHIIDARLPTGGEKDKLATTAQNAPVDVTGARDDREGALASLLAAPGLITDSITATWRRYPLG